MSSRARYCKWQNQQTPRKWFVKLFNKKERNYFKQQLKKWEANPEFEIIEQRKATSAKWEWS